MGGWAYILRCSDRSFYVGSTSAEDVATRLAQHNDGIFGGYTSSRRPVELVWAEWFLDSRDAHVAERKIKGWSRAKKQALIEHDWPKLQNLAKRPSARRPSRLAALAPQGDAFGVIRHPEVQVSRGARGTRASKDDEAGST